MRPLLFATRMAFICNMLFILCLIIQRTYDFIPSKDLSSMVVLLGWIVAPIQNLIANIWYGLVLVSKSSIRLPLWIAVTNMVLLIIQFIVFIILP
ncbi:MAG TPA: hypothetical protein PLC18_08665 [Sediminibacterium sp.]|jgi:hypothetical protein|uniref:hypothetical protein n=1 Tax=Sediminibacterium sp. TaxID=1917865 RepID=UPI0025F6CB0F|nr:hypothetical protein [Sediminibacterium sp.]MBT9484734.1 hypothetical protein [Sediminibacterium sp.]HQS35474.1 hypothetical protein [Sediminibacterium sp.]